MMTNLKKKKKKFKRKNTDYTLNIASISGWNILSKKNEHLNPTLMLEAAKMYKFKDLSQCENSPTLWEANWKRDGLAKGWIQHTSYWSSNC